MEILPQIIKTSCVSCGRGESERPPQIIKTIAVSLPFSYSMTIPVIPANSSPKVQIPSQQKEIVLRPFQSSLKRQGACGRKRCVAGRGAGVDRCDPPATAQGPPPVIRQQHLRVRGGILRGLSHEGCGGVGSLPAVHLQVSAFHKHSQKAHYGLSSINGKHQYG